MEAVAVLLVAEGQDHLHLQTVVPLKVVRPVQVAAVQAIPINPFMEE
jgi:hypothetical protein